MAVSQPEPRARDTGGRPARITVITGPEIVIQDRELAEVVDDQRSRHPDLAVLTIDCGAKANVDDPSAPGNPERLAQAFEPSLFGDPPIVVVRGLESADEESQQVLKAALADTSGSPLVLVHSGAAKGRAVINAAKKSGARVIKCQRPKERDVRSLMRQEAKRAGGRLSPPAEQWLLDAIGGDSLAVLLAAVRQSVFDCDGSEVAESQVRAVFPMQAKVSAFKVVDHIWSGNLDEATRLLRGMERREKGVGVAVLAAIAHGLRMMALVGRPGSQPPAGVNIAPWQIDRARANARNWGASAARIAAVSARLPELDAAMKGGLTRGTALDDEQKMAVLEALILRLGTPPGRR